jgi:hypothetical protein
MKEMEKLTNVHFLLLRIMAIRSKHLTNQAINKLTFILIGPTPNSRSDKEGVRQLLRELKAAGLVKTRFTKTKEDPGGVYKWKVTKQGHKVVEEWWREFYSQVKHTKEQTKNQGGEGNENN